MKTLRVGTRGSKLALIQTEYVIDLLRNANDSYEFETFIIKTSGDQDQTTPLAEIGGTGLFTKAIEKALSNGEINFAIHSAKDLPSKNTEGLTLGAIPVRASVSDVLISKDGVDLNDIMQGAIIGTGSPRRKAMLLNVRPDLQIKPIRGNIETRLHKLDTGEFDAIVMAEAALIRLACNIRKYSILPREQFIPAPGQGAIAVEIREKDAEVIKLAKSINDPQSSRTVDVERRLMARLGAGCSAPVGLHAYFKDETIRLEAVILDTEGKKKLYSEHSINTNKPDEELIDMVYGELRSLGALELIDEFRQK